MNFGDRNYLPGLAGVQPLFPRKKQKGIHRVSKRRGRAVKSYLVSSNLEQRQRASGHFKSRVQIVQIRVVYGQMKCVGIDCGSIVAAENSLC